MAILTQEVRSVSGGLSKGIERGAEQLVFDLLQKHQYQHPVKSTIREVVSNGLDSIREKQIARSILTGKSAVEDHYIQMEGELYKDSGFDPEYYDLSFLSHKDAVEVIYCDGGDTGKDTVVIRDYGVGLGGERLAGYFQLGFSSKRLNKFALGKFGLGAKSPLSTGAPYYTVISRHNGREFVFQVYAHKVDSIVPSMDLDSGSFFPEYEFKNGYRCHYRRTKETNGVEIQLQVKKHHKQQYIDAVTSQLLYFNNVRCYVKEVSGQMTEVPVRAEIMYEDNLIVLANNSPYSKPHILLAGVNYGYIDFKELELEEKLGNIGIKVDPEKVSVNPSRESLIWDETTREVILDTFKSVVDTAGDMINRELTETDFLKWLRICVTAAASKQMFGNAAKDTILGRLAQVVDLKGVKLRYAPDNDIVYGENILSRFNVHVVKLEKVREGSLIKTKVNYDAGYWRSGLIDGLPLILQHTAMSNRKNKYILQHLYPQGFISLRMESFKEDNSPVVAADVIDSKLLDDIRNSAKLRVEGKTQEVLDKVADKLARMHNYIYASQGQLWYESIEVPDDFKASEDAEDTEEETQTEEAKESAAERRKLKGATILHTPRQYGGTPSSETERAFEMQKVEVPVAVIDTWHNPEVFYSSNDYEPLLHLAAMMTRPAQDITDRTTDPSVVGRKSGDQVRQEYEVFKSLGYENVNQWEFSRTPWLHEDADVRLIKVAKDNVKYYRDFKHIIKFFKDYKTINNKKTITMSNALTKWNTGRLMQERISELQFLRGFASIDKQKAIAYERIKGYIDKYWRSIDINKNYLGTDDSTTKGIVNYLDKVGQFQLFVRDNPTDVESISKLAVQLFNPEKGVEIEDGCAIDTEVYDLYTELLDWAQPVKVLMNTCYPLTSGYVPTEEQEVEIRNYFKYRNCPL